MSKTAELIQEIQSYMTDAQDLCERGAFVELAGLEKRVGKICTSIQSMSPQDAQTQAKELDRLMLSLDELQKIFQSKRDALGNELNDTHKHHNAAKAYTQSDHSAPQTGEK